MNEIDFNIDDIRFELSCAANNLDVIADRLIEYTPATKELNKLVSALLFAAQGIAKISQKIDVLTRFANFSDYNIT